MSIKIFISHKEKDSKKAEYIAYYIKKNYDFDVYVDILDNDINSTTNITEKIVKKLRESTHLLVIFSEHTKGSMWVPFELGVSYERGQGIGVYNYPDNKNVAFNLPEYLDDFPKLNNNEDLDSYLEEVKKYPNISIENLINENAVRNINSYNTNYAKTFIDNLKNKLK